MSEDTLNQTSPGPALTAAREAANLTVREVSEALNLSITVVEAIESGNQERLPAPVFTRGYVRAYAKLLGLDPEPLVAGMDAQERSLELPLNQQNKKTIALNLSPSAYAIGGFILILVLIWVVWPAGEVSDQGPVVATDPSRPMVPSGRDEDLRTSAQINPPSSSGADEVETTEAAGMMETIQADTVSPSAENTASRTGLAADARDEATSPGLEANQAAMLDPSDGYRPLTDSGSQRLSLDFTEECWVEIKDIQGETLFADLGRPGRSFRFKGEGPFQILLGYAPGALLSFNEEPVALSPHTRNNVASVVLGQ
jgi:cytoskeleton protein RodZ